MVDLSKQQKLLRGTRSLQDISYSWSAVYTMGLAFNIAYLLLESALVGWICGLLEISLAIAVIVSKIYLDAEWRR
jgi:hypothetical protein